MPRASMRILPVAAGAALAACSWCAVSCGGDDHREYTANVDPEFVATMTTTDVSTLISDSGITRYRVVTPLWLVYDEARESRWRFPSGLHLERFDDFFNRIMEGYGFESNNSMTDFKVRDVSAILPVEQFSPGSSSADSLSAPAPPVDQPDTTASRPRQPQPLGQRHASPDSSASRPARAVKNLPQQPQPTTPAPKRPRKIKLNDQQ